MVKIKTTTEEKFRKELAKWGITCGPRLGVNEYIVATNILIIEELKKLNKKTNKTMLDY